MSPSRVVMAMPGMVITRASKGGRPIAVAGVAGPDIDAEHQLSVVVADDVHLVAVESPGGRSRAWRIRLYLRWR
jgi:hypothetical protein